MNLGELWTFLLELIGQILVPVWKDLIQYIPVLILLLVVVAIAWLAWTWQRNAAANRPRIPRRSPSGRRPAGMHLPVPSPWPFVAPIGLVLIVFAVVFGLDSLADLALLGLGLAVGLSGVVGWYRDAKREFVALESGGHGSDGSDVGRSAMTAGAIAAGAMAAGAMAPTKPARAPRPPEGIHMPGPSAWPFLAPIGLVFAVAGLVFGPALLVGGLIMGGIACIGWLRDASRELASVEAHGQVEPVTRDPERAFPKALGPVFVFVAGLSILVTLTPWLLSLLPGGG